MGDVDIAEVAIMASLDSTVTVTALVSSDNNKDSIGSVPVLSSFNDNNVFDNDHVVVICDARSPQACFDELITRLPFNRIFFPKSFHIITSDAANEAA